MAFPAVLRGLAASSRPLFAPFVWPRTNRCIWHGRRACNLGPGKCPHPPERPGGHRMTKQKLSGICWLFLPFDTLFESGKKQNAMDWNNQHQPTKLDVFWDGDPSETRVKKWVIKSSNWDPFFQVPCRFFWCVWFWGLWWFMYIYSSLTRHWANSWHWRFEDLTSHL